jgi:hypothetical protein
MEWVFYIAFENNEGKTMDVTLDIMASWSDNWIQENAQFEEELNSDDDLRVFLARCLWFGMKITAYKHGFQL